MRKTQQWTDEEVAFLLEAFPVMNKAELLLVFPGRSERSITRKAGNLGLTKTSETLTRTRSAISSENAVDPYPDITKEVLEELYLSERMSTRDIAEKFGCHSSTISTRLHKYDIPTRTSSSDFTDEEKRRLFGSSGESHHNWRGGITDVTGLIRNSLAPLSLECFKRDGFRCVECGEGEHKLNAHHIRQFSDIVQDIRDENGCHELSTWEQKDKLVSLCVEDDRLLDLDNLVTLCVSCHYRAHHADLKSKYLK